MLKLVSTGDAMTPPAQREKPAPSPRPWPRWVTGGSVALGALAALGLAITVLVAQRALGEASDIVVRGEGAALVTAVSDDLATSGGPFDAKALAASLAKHEAEGLRYLAVVDRPGSLPLASAGQASVEGPLGAPGDLTVVGRRARLVSNLGPPRPPNKPAGGPGGEPPRPPPGGGPGRGPHGPPVLVLEIEPPVIAALRADLALVAVVGGVAAAVLLAFALAWSRSVARLAAVEQKAEHERRLVALGRMSSVMAHELRNPLASLKGHAQLLAESLEGDAKNHAKAERVVAGAERLEQLTSSLLDFVREGPIDVRPVAPAELAMRAIEHLPAERVRLELSSAPVELEVDPALAALALRNLVENAIHAAPDGGPVTVRFEAAGEGALIEVRDRGPGLPAGGEEAIFEPFFTTRVRGTGLGLPIARRIAEQHGGTLTGEDHPGGGAVFRLRLP